METMIAIIFNIIQVMIDWKDERESEKKTKILFEESWREKKRG